MGEARARGTEEERVAQAQWRERIAAAQEVALDAAALIEVVDEIVATEKAAGAFVKGEEEHSERTRERDRRGELLRVAAQLATGTSFLVSDEDDEDEDDEPPEPVLPPRPGQRRLAPVDDLLPPP